MQIRNLSRRRQSLTSETAKLQNLLLREIQEKSKKFITVESDVIDLCYDSRTYVLPE